MIEKIGNNYTPDDLKNKLNEIIDYINKKEMYTTPKEVIDYIEKENVVNESDYILENKE